MLIILKKEFFAFLNSLIAYIVIGVFLLLTGLVVWIYPDSNVLDYGYADLTSFFELCPYILILISPAITMRMLSEEFRTGTIELLFTKPLSTADIVTGKFLAALSILVLALIPTLIYYFSIYQLGNPVGNVDSASVAGSYFGLVLLASAYSAIGIFTSSLTSNQVVAFIIAAALSYFFYDGIHQLAQLFRGSAQYYTDYFSLSFHYSSLGRGVIDSRNLIFLLSFVVVFIMGTILILDKKKN